MGLRRPTMTVCRKVDVTTTLEQALQASRLDKARGMHQPRQRTL
jgi:hypothetical protein